ncbi:endoglucanase G-like isoform X2 [Watersipora subatra]|uniref:endoglucanase G-like isoform X2 n=1 Tax=Watersipora subatra TaxID=2589382 RepID=UPI00355C8240
MFTGADLRRWMSRTLPGRVMSWGLEPVRVEGLMLWERLRQPLLLDQSYLKHLTQITAIICLTMPLPSINSLRVMKIHIIQLCQRVPNFIRVSLLMARSSSWEDEMAHAAAWLALAHQGTTEETTYLTESQNYLKDDFEQYMWALGWNDKRGLVNFLLYHQLQDSRFSGNLETFIGRWLPGNDVPYTPLGLAFRLEWGNNRYAANAAFLSLLAASEGINEQAYRDFAKSQIDYMLGLVDGGRSYVVGFDSESPKRAHHRAASCPLPEDDATCNWADYHDDVDNPNTLYGALVGGPDANDLYIDERTDFTKNGVSCDYNAGFTGALAGLLHFGERS